jgi:hypothetical protein
MIISVWKPKRKVINNNQVIIQYDLMDINCIYNKGTTGYKVIWKCDNINCKHKNKIHSIQRSHLNRNKSKLCNENIQICRSCQFSGINNPRFGDNRKWEDFMGVEKANEMKVFYSNKFKGNSNPSKKDVIKQKKGQIIINYDNVFNYVKKYGFKLNKIDGKDKNSILSLTCMNNHKIDIRYSSFRSGHRCKFCYYESMMISPNELDSFRKYSNIVRSRTRTIFRKYKELIDPNNLTIDSKKYHIDHIYSISDGYKNNIDPLIISSYVNLRVIGSIENLKKGKKSEIIKDELIIKYQSSNTQ